MEIIDLAVWTAGAVIVVGIMQWAKGAVKKAPKWVWTAALPVVSVAVSILGAFKIGEFNSIPWNAAGIWAISQTGYELIIQTIRYKLGQGKEDN